MKLLLTALLFIFSSNALAQTSADLVLLNGKIRTVNERQPEAKQ